jgi:hypothetical protein
MLRSEGNTMRPDARTTFAIGGALALALLACKKEGAPAPAASEAAKPTTPAGPAAPPAAPAADTPTAKAPSFKISDVPDIPSGKSNPPQGAEWDQGVAVNTQGANARAKRCSMHVLREWLRIYCSGKVVGYEKKEDFGELGSDYYEKFVDGKYASLVIRLKKGENQKIRICREDDRASLFVSWPPSTDKPKNIALGHGPPCDGSDWGAGYGKGGGQAMKAKPGEGGDDADLAALKASSDAAAKDCKAGNKDACWFYCGEASCN